MTDPLQTRLGSLLKRHGAAGYRRGCRCVVCRRGNAEQVRLWRWRKERDAVAILAFTGDYGFLSNFWPCEIEHEGMVYPSVEHAYQAAKTLDRLERVRVKNKQTPGEAKKAGRRVTLRPGWNGMRLEVMEELVRKKFQDPQLRGWLIETGEQRIEEGNHWKDRFWGTYDGEGHNHLGRILMKVREEIRGE